MNINMVAFLVCGIGAIVDVYIGLAGLGAFNAFLAGVNGTIGLIRWAHE